MITPSFFSNDAARVEKKVGRIWRGMKSAVGAAIDRFTTKLANKIRENLSKGGKVARSRKVKGRVRIIPRNPGNDLRVITGFLRSSWRTVPARSVGGYIEGHVKSNAPYAAIHEFGGVTGRNYATTIPRRPYVHPAIKDLRGRLAFDVKIEVGKLLATP